MGLPIEFNVLLALRNISEFKSGKRKREECIPENIKSGDVFEFLKSDQRVYFIGKEIALVETRGGENLSRPLASIIILECAHFRENERIYTRGKYEVVEVFDSSDDTVHFELCKRRR